MKRTQSASADEWVDKMWHSYTVEYYSTVKRNGVLIDATTEMNLKSVMLTEKKSDIRAHKLYDSVY